MPNWFEDLTKTVADETIGRRTAMRRIAGGIAGVVLASGVPGLALASQKPCTTGGSCPTGFKRCPGNKNPNCLCYQRAKGLSPQCGCNHSCSNLVFCTTDASCGVPGQFCAYNTCCNPPPNMGICIAACAGTNKHCKFMSETHSGPTTAHA